MKPIVLIVDDDPAGRSVIEAVLSNQGYALEFAVNGREALQKTSALKPDLILLDLMLPEMDGMEVVQRLRKMRDLSQIPVVMITALDDRNIRIASLDAGADDFISKPFDKAELRARVHTITRLNRYRLLHERDLITSWIAEKASDGYLQLDMNDRILFANPRARFYLGLDNDRNKPVDVTFMELVLRQYIPRPTDAWLDWPHTAVNPVSNRFLVRPESQSAHEFWLETAIFEIPAAEDRPGMRVIRLRDVTADVLNRRNTRSFGEAVTHKIRTPVTQIVSNLDLLAKHAQKMSPEEVGQFCSAALRGAKRLQESLDRILKYSSAQASPDQAGGFALADLAPLIGKLASEIGIERMDVSVSDDLSASRLTLPLRSLEVLFWETLGNSKKFHPGHAPTVTVEAFRSGARQATVRIGDDGVTLSPKQLTTAWLPYYQGEKDFTGEAPGMGLGLSTVSAIVWGIGGSCRIANREARKGVIVELVMPLDENESERQIS